ncbi:unnamed protein product, partial [Gongylonema pulchrum]|uniref:Golgi apparatus protein 1 n=1 Tax=Gongylonema pulchrum TaxID=637853 RepID=A0A183D1G4_9BILA
NFAAGGQQAQQPQQAPTFEKHLTDYEECKEDVHKYCSRPGLDLKSDMAILDCLQYVKLSETELLTAPCEHLVWEFKVNLTQDERFRFAAQEFCRDEIATRPVMAQCLQKTQPGYALSCLVDTAYNIYDTRQKLPRETRCFQFLGKSHHCL